VPAERRVSEPSRDAVKIVVGMEQQARYQAFLKDRQQRNTHHPKGGPTPLFSPSFLACHLLNLPVLEGCACVVITLKMPLLEAEAPFF